jgi:glycosyltransferase involved in cell wall biosynthesis
MVKPCLAIVVPCYNEEEVLFKTTKELVSVIKNLISEELVAQSSFILYVYDGSQDRIWSIISDYYQMNSYVCGVNLAGNVGPQRALIAGLSVAVKRADIMITIDVDLQEDVGAIPEMVRKFYSSKADIVCGVRNNRDTDTFFKRSTALLFYKIMQGLGVKSVYNHADYRLMTNRAVKFLLDFPERNLFLRSLVLLLGYPTEKVYYNCLERYAGKSKYPLKKMINFCSRWCSVFLYYYTNTLSFHHRGCFDVCRSGTFNLGNI